ncbi:MAG: NAD(P)H-dependent oxidoreductase subunit E [Chitinivibrionales bacterium]|nr:NAD(P)H-dependent oxidoreductase subunit E [Chitinivibrionales bacterium]
MGASKTQTSFEFTQKEQELLEQLDTRLDEYRSVRSPLIIALQETQKMFGYVPLQAIELIARKLHEPLGKIHGVVTFYSFFSMVPRGKYTVRVCLGTACYVRGGTEVLAAIKKELGIEVGETSKDRLFTLEVGRCFGACGLAPVIMVNDTVHQRVKPTGVRQILNQYRAAELAAVKE